MERRFSMNNFEESLKEHRRRMAEEQIEASRLEELAKKEKRQQLRKKELLEQEEAARRTEMGLRREIARLQAATLKSASVFPRPLKDAAHAASNEEESLFVSDDSDG